MADSSQFQPVEVGATLAFSRITPIPPPPILAVKSYIGNLGAASGSTELAASLLAFHHGRLPSTLNYEHADPRCPVRVAVGDPMACRKPYAIKLGFTELGQCAAVVVRRWEE